MNDILYAGVVILFSIIILIFLISSIRDLLHNKNNIGAMFTTFIMCVLAFIFVGAVLLCL